MRILLVYASLSGNTRELAKAVAQHCERDGHVVEMIEADCQAEDTLNATMRQCVDGFYELYLLGTWTDNAGLTPVEMKRFIAEFVNVVGKPSRVAVFGTGETQWGEEYYCGAVHRIARFFATDFPRLCIEQMPHGVRDAQAIAQWVHDVLFCAKQELVNEHIDPSHT